MVRVIQSGCIFLQRITWDTGGCIRRSGEDDLGNLFVFYFLRKDKNPLTHSRSSKYDANKYVWNGTPESSDVREVEVPKLSEGKRGTNLDHYGRRSIIQRLTTPDAQQRKA